MLRLAAIRRTQRLVRPAAGGKRAVSNVAAFNGVSSSYFTKDAGECWRTDPGEFPVLRQLEPSGELLPGITFPFQPEEAKKIYKCMVRSQQYDMVLEEMQRQGRISFYCTNYGEEAASTGSAAALKTDDMIWPQYRELGMFLYRGLTIQNMVDGCMGNDGDVNRGRALPVHYMLPNVQVVHAVLGTHIPQAPGAGYGYKLRSEDKVSVAYFGDGAASEGDALVALNFASLYGSQTLFICRNNGYSISTPVSDQYAGDGIAGRGLAFGIQTIRVDGNDVVAVYNATKAAREISVSEKCPVLLELMTYRVGHHTTSDDSSKYRPPGEIDSWKKELEPIGRYKNLLMSQSIWDEAQEKELVETSRQEVLDAMHAGEQKLRPPVEDMFNDTYASPLPWHLKEQQEYLEQHVEEYPDEYNMHLYRGMKA